MLEQPGLDGRRQLDAVVNRRHAVKVGPTEIEIGRTNEIERFSRAVDLLALVVDDEHHEAFARVVIGERPAEHARVVQVVAGADGAQAHDYSPATARRMPLDRIVAAGQRTGQPRSSRPLQAFEWGTNGKPPGLR